MKQTPGTGRSDRQAQEWLRRSIVAATASLLILLCVAPGVAATQSTFQASRTMVDGGSILEATLLAVAFDGLSPQEDDALEAFVLSAGRLQIETDRSDLVATTPIASNNHAPYTVVRDAVNAHIESAGHRSAYRVSVWPMDGVEATIASHCGELTPGSGTMQRDPRVAGAESGIGRPPSTADISTAVQWAACDDASIIITGDFLLRLWEWDAELTVDNETSILWSGHRELEGEASALSPVVTRVQEQYIYAYNATLEIHSLTGNYEVYLHDVAVQGGAFQFKDARGTLAGHNLDAPLTLHGEDISVTGDLSVEVGNSDGRLTAALDGDMNAYRLNGGNPVIVQPARATENLAVMAIIVGVAAVALLIAASRAAPRAAYQVNRAIGGQPGSLAPRNRREQRAVGQWVLGKLHHGMGHRRRALRLARRAQAGFPYFGDGHLLAAEVLFESGRLDESLVAFEHAMPLLETAEKQARTACMAADAACRVGDTDLAREWLRDAARCDADIALLHADNHRFTGVTDTDWFDTWVGMVRHRRDAGQ